MITNGSHPSYMDPHLAGSHPQIPGQTPFNRLRNSPAHGWPKNRGQIASMTNPPGSYAVSTLHQLEEDPDGLQCNAYRAADEPQECQHAEKKMGTCSCPEHAEHDTSGSGKGAEV